MICMFCVDDKGEYFSKSEVLETRQFWDPNDDFYYNQRRRKCLSCETKFTTIERLAEDE